MDTAENKLAFQVQFWGLIGPLIALVALFVILIKTPSQSLYLSIATILGILTSLKWKLKGAFIGAFALLVCYIYQYSEITPDEHLWHIGMSVSILTACAITALSLYEMEDLLHPLIKSHLCQMEGISLSKELGVKLKQIASYELLVEKVKSEIALKNEQHEELFQSFLQKEHELSLTEEKWAQASAKIQREVTDLQKSLQIKEEELQQSKGKEPHVDTPALLELKSTNELLLREKGRLETQLFRTQIDLHQKAQELMNMSELQKELDDLKEEKKVLSTQLSELKEIPRNQPKTQVENETQLLFDLKKMEGKYHQLREQFELKSNVLNATRKELFKTNEEVLRLQLEREEREIYLLSEDEIAMQQYHLSLIADFEQKMKELEIEIQELQKIITTLFNSN